VRVALRHVAHTRSGDKGDISNIAVFAWSEALYPVIETQLTAARFREFHRGAIRGEVRRYEVPGLLALNFVCLGALGGGVSRSLSLDNYGKALSAAVLGCVLDVPDHLYDQLRGAPATGGERLG